MIALQLFLVFFKIGMFCFGGGYAMISVIEGELLSRGWIESAQYANVVALSQVTPGPLAVNVATYVGAVMGNSIPQGICYSAAATIGVSMPSFILIYIIARFFKSFGDSRAVKDFMGGVSPSVIGLIAGAAVSLCKRSIFDIDKLVALDIANSFNIGAVIIAIVAAITSLKTKLNPMLILLGAGLAGIFIF